MSDERGRISDQLAGSFREQILAGDLKPGDRLPSERKIAEKHSVNRAGVREALKMLEKDRLIRIQHGGGAVVTDFWREGGLDLCQYLLNISGRLDLDLLDNLLESRRIFCREVTRMAVGRISSATLERLRTVQRHAVTERNNLDRLQQLDFDFFYTLARGSGNRVLMLMMNNMRELYMSYRGIFRALYWDIGDYLNTRQQIIDAVATGDSERAAELTDRLLSVSTFTVTRSSV